MAVRFGAARVGVARPHRGVTTRLTVLDNRADGLLAVSLNSVDDREWVLGQIGATELTEIGRLTGGITSLMLALKVDERDLVLRRIDRQPWLRFASELLTRVWPACGPQRSPHERPSFLRY